MPELPDVEAFKRYLDATGLHKTIKGVHVANRTILAAISGAKLAREVRGETIERSRRHGKHLFAALGHEKWLTLHFGMTGHLDYFKDLDDDPRHDRLRFDLDNGDHLAFVDQRMFGRVGLTADPETYIAEAHLGPDALALSGKEKAFAARFAKRRGQVKAALMDQSILAGIGNIYSDEILFQARLHPKARVEGLNSSRIAALCRATHSVLKTAIECDPTTDGFIDRLPKRSLLPHRRTGGHCPGCGGAVATLKAAGRISYYCPACQKSRD